MSVLGAVIGGALGLIGSNKAAKAQTSAADASIGYKREIYDETVNRLSPYTSAGNDALQAYRFELGLGGQPAGYGGIGLSPAAQFQMQQGRDTIEAGASSGGLYSGATMQALEDYRSGLATQDRDNQLNRLAGLASMGQNAAAGAGSLGANFAQSVGNTMVGAGNARAAGYVGGANAITGAIDNYYGYQAMNRLAQ